jgi:uncharacterized membrane protein YbhN (UPF0104 family)
MKRWVRPILQIASIGIFALIIWWSGRETWETVLNGIPYFVALALLLQGLAGMVSASRLQLTTTAISGRQFVWRRIYHLNMTARALGLVVPRSLSTIGGKSVALRSFGISLRRSVWIVMLDNIFDVLLLTALCLPGAFYLRGSISGPIYLGAVIVIILLLAAAVWLGSRSTWLITLLNWLRRRFPWLAHRLGFDGLNRQRPLPPAGTVLVIFFITCLLNSILAFSFYAINLAVGGQADALIFLAAYPFVQLTLVAAVTPGGLGLFELGWLGLLSLAGVPQSEALNFVVAQRVYISVFVLIWAGLSVLIALTVRRSPDPEVTGK